MKQLAHNLIKHIDDLINRITMYRLLLWGLRILFGISWLFSSVDVLPFGPIRPLVSISILIAVCLGTNWVLSRAYKTVSNSESSNITALLLYFIFKPPETVREGAVLALAGLLAIASKYIFTRGKRHIFNPAAFGAAFLSITGLYYSRWWIGSGTMFILMLIFGLLVVRKIHRFPMVLSFISVALLLYIIRGDTHVLESVRLSLVSFPLIFFASLMLTEPITTPPRRYQQIVYGVFVGILVSSGVRIPGLTMTPELALLIGNVLVLLAFPRILQELKLESIEEIGRTIYEYRFKPLQPLVYLPGQYVELTLPLDKNDALGNRRSFTIASSPTEDDIRFGVKHNTAKSSAFKQHLLNLPEGSIVTANNLAGDFLLPHADTERLVFIAGGIGITPFRSHLKYLIDERKSRTITLFYAVSDPKQIVYKDILEEAKEFGLKVVYVLTPPAGEEVPKSWKGEVGVLTSDMIKKHVLDYDRRVYYISGPSGMVQANKKLLRDIGVARDQIRTDYFSGY